MSELPRRPLASADPVEVQFGRFYAARLRRVVGARLKACDVMHAYQENLAHEKRAHSIGFRRLKALMQSLG
uniref:hypothetical protein n=1 Tax=Staphylococcus agnetis TaxID=985762 RepID=UPI0039EC9D54